MKKVLLAMVVAIASVIPAMAQFGETRIGIDLGVAPCIEKGSDVTNFILNAKTQIELPADFRLEAKIGYDFRDKGISAITGVINGHYMIDIAPRFQMYPLAGIGSARVKYSGHGYSDSHIKFLFNVGVGGEFKITSKISANIEFKYQYISHFSRFPVSVGVSYAF